MKKTIKLTEADILKMVKRILEEQISFSSPNGFLPGNNINKQGSVGQRRFDKVVAEEELKKAGYKVYPDYKGSHALKFTADKHAFLIMIMSEENSIEFVYLPKDSASEYLERGNMENIDDYPRKGLSMFDFTRGDQFAQVLKKFEQYAVAQKLKKYGPTNAADVTPRRQSGLNETIKRHLREVAEEPVITGNGEHTSGYFTFAEGKAVPTKVNGQPFDNALRSRIVNALAKFIQSSVPTLQKFINDPKFKLPKFIQVNVGTSHTASPEANVAVATQRGEYLRKLISDALIQLKIRPDVVYQIVTTNTDAQYQPSKLDTSFYDARVLAPNADERFGEIRIKDLSTQGMNTAGIQNVQHGLNDAASIVNTILVDNVDEDAIVYNLRKLQTYSDIQDLDNAIKAQGHEYNSLEDFLNDQLFDDNIHMTQVAKHLNKCAMKSSLPDQTIRLVRDSSGHYRISINLTAK